MSTSIISLQAIATMVAAESAADHSITQPSSGKRKLSGSYMMMGMLGAIVVAGGVGISTLSNSDDSNKISATLKCPIPNSNENLQTPDAQTKTYFVMGSPCSPESAGTRGEFCRALIMTQLTCTWEGFELGGQVISKSLMHGQGYMEGDYSKASVDNGYDWGQTAAGDQYLARWIETMSPTSITGTWTLTQGSGALEGISGEAFITCEVPKAGDIVEVCQATGSYSLPK